ncbi:hypothetical protein [Miltoncostaea oceani]|uniref:hypothetical protein n=1 Tax=Miltoncostaea oceani TaxID=2843216 RepID=UPI001C3DF66B|nr:hypothetical protein [Miltoncostaea oceani]
MTDTPPPADQPAEHPVPAEAPTAAEATPPVARRRWMPRRRADAPADAPAEAAPPAATPPPTAPPSGDASDDAPVVDATGDVPLRGAAPRRLRRERRRLITRREEAVYHLGGLAFELYRRDMLGEDVMRRRAGEVAEIDDTVRDIDVRLGELDRERRDRRRVAEPDPAAGCCLTCRTPFRAEARFCWQCGTQVVPPSMGDEQVTAVISVRPPA